MSKLTDLQSHLSSIIWDLRRKKGWSQSEVARKLKTSPGHIWRLEDRHQCKPTITTLVKIAKLYKKDVSIMFIDSNIKNL